MSAIIIDGRKSAETIKNQISVNLKSSKKELGLGTILVGNDPGSVAYVDGKHRDCSEVGISSIKVNLPAISSEDEIIAAIEKLNKIDPNKDADGLHPFNLGNLVLSKNSIIPCTPKAIWALLSEYKVNLSGTKVLIIGRGSTVGRPLSILLSQKNIDATVTLAHSATRNLTGLINDADVVVAAIGKPHFIKPEMIKSGAVVIDVGITRTQAGLVGDVDPGVINIASLFAPMPGGVGPMTRAMLLTNLVELANR
jgi:methylenetetrahydrofolate dehydrogenase (NADP+) / methenyltetrahydrofolate cyclohydrolase